jgi:DNA-binding transcriptional LysR family regulator
MSTTLSAGPVPATRGVASTRRTVALTAAGVVVAGAATSIVALTVTAIGAADGFAPLRPALYLPFVAIGVIATVIGWRIIRSRTENPVAVLRVLVPAVLLVSFVPDAILIVTRFIPGTTLIGGLSLSVMHLIVAAVAVPLAQRIAPVGARAR